MTFFRKKLVFKYKREKDNEKEKWHEYPAVNLILGEGENAFETAAIIDSGSDFCFISEEIAEILNLKLDAEDEAEVLGGGLIKIRPSKVKMTLVRGNNQISLGFISVFVGINIKTKESDMGIVLGRNPIFDVFKITFEQYKKRVIFEKVDPKWRQY